MTVDIVGRFRNYVSIVPEPLRAEAIGAIQTIKESKARSAYESLRAISLGYVNSGNKDAYLRNSRKPMSLARAKYVVSSDDAVQALVNDFFCGVDVVDGAPGTDIQSQTLHGAWLCRWGESGLPTIVLTGKQAASLALTNHDGVGVMPPWRAFLVKVASDAFDTQGQKLHGVRVIRRASEHAPPDDDPGMDGKWSVMTDVGDYTLWENNRWPQELMTGELLAPERERQLGTLETEPKEIRLRRLLCRMVISLCVVISGGAGSLRRPSKRARKSLGMVTPVGNSNEWTLGLPVTIDTRGVIQDYLSGSAKRVYSVRWVVRGHLRNQACGAGLQERKKRWIEPYWKGPERAPMLLREHKLKTA